MADNNTLIAIDIPSLDHTTFSLSFNQSKSHTTWIDWGDNNHNQREIYDEVGIISLIHTYAEPGQYNIELIVVDDGTIDLISIGDDEGYHNMITQVTIGSAVTSIGERVFSDCNNLEELYFSDTCLSEIKPYAFANCNSLTKIILPKDINLLDGVFYNCSGLKEVTLPDNISTIWTNTFSGCSQLKKVNVSEENNIYEIADYAFQGCRKLQDIDFCKNVNIIGNSAFDSCSSLSDVEFTAVESIGNNAFCNCTFLMQANISSEIKDIGEGAFMNDKFLKVIKIGATKAPILHGMNAFNLDGDFTIKVPQGSKKRYIRETNWTVFADRIEEE